MRSLKSQSVFAEERKNIMGKETMPFTGETVDDLHECFLLITRMPVEVLDAVLAQYKTCDSLRHAMDFAQREWDLY